jgi:hypothetical protein
MEWIFVGPAGASFVKLWMFLGVNRFFTVYLGCQVICLPNIKKNLQMGINIIIIKLR